MLSDLGLTYGHSCFFVKPALVMIPDPLTSNIWRWICNVLLEIGSRKIQKDCRYGKSKKRQTLYLYKTQKYVRTYEVMWVIWPVENCFFFKSTAIANVKIVLVASYYDYNTVCPNILYSITYIKIRIFSQHYIVLSVQEVFHPFIY